MERLILVRHGETDINTKGVLHRSEDLEPLSEIGRGQIRQTAEKLKDYSPKGLCSSKEVRAIQSGEIISEVLELELETIDGLQERNWGDFSGKPWTEVQAILDPMTLEERYTFVPPNGESWKQFEDRLVKVISELAEKHKGETIVVVTHGGAIRALMPYLLTAPKEESFKHNPDNASLTIFSTEEGVRSLEMANDTSHLQE
jgi:broad specificity phosphatase PhoE